MKREIYRRRKEFCRFYRDNIVILGRNEHIFTVTRKHFFDYFGKSLVLIALMLLQQVITKRPGANIPFFSRRSIAT